MTNRQATIVFGLIREYIRSAQPVSSQHLRLRLRLSESPATIRTVMRELELAGYITQPHTSAGRIPTDKGYRYYVNRLPQPQVDREAEQQIVAEIRELRRRYEIARATSKALANLARTLAVGVDLEGGTVQEAGLSELINQPEADEPRALQEISSLIDRLDRHIDELTALGQEACVLIGKENPILNSRHTSLVVRTINNQQSRPRLVLLLIGPKRMPYERHVALLNNVANLMSHHHYGSFF